MIEPRITSIRYYASSTPPKVKPKVGDKKFFKGAGHKRRGWYVRQFQRVTFGPHTGAMVRTRNGPCYEWVRMEEQPPEPDNV